MVSQISSPQPHCSDRLQVSSSLLWQSESIPVFSFIDSGADDNFIDAGLVKQAKIPTELIEAPSSVNALNGDQLAKITHRTAPFNPPTVWKPQ